MMIGLDEVWVGKFTGSKKTRKSNISHEVGWSVAWLLVDLMKPAG